MFDEEDYDSYLRSVWQLLFMQLRRHLVAPLDRWEPGEFMANAANTQLQQGELLRDSLVAPVYQGEEHRAYYGFVTEIAWLVESGAQFGGPCPALRHTRMGIESYLALFKRVLGQDLSPFVFQWQSAAWRLLGEEWELAFGLRREWFRQSVDASLIHRVLQKRMSVYPIGTSAEKREERFAYEFFSPLLRNARDAGGWALRHGSTLGEDLCVLACAMHKTGDRLAPACREFASAWESDAEDLPLLAQSRYGWVRAIALTRMENETGGIDN